jgi:hypothetical protein
MILDPFRLYRRHQRLQREAVEEAQHLRRRYGDQAIDAALERLARPDITKWGHQVMTRALAILRKG